MLPPRWNLRWPYVTPSAGNIAGGGFMVIRTADSGFDAIDYREKAPAAATANMYLGSDGEPVAGSSLNTHLASGVPGMVNGIWQAHSKYGLLPWQEIVGPAIDLARKGFPLTANQASSLNNMKERFLSRNQGRVAFVKDSQWSENDTLVQEDLAKTLELIRDLGPAGFYGGVTAEKIVNEMKRGGGIITASDLENYNAVWRAPLQCNYRGYKIVSMAPPSSGGVALIQLLNMVEPYDLTKMGFGSSEIIHLMAEAERRVYADRAEYLGDPDFVNVPVGKLTDSDYNLNRMTGYDPNRATPSASVSAGNPFTFKESEETTHYSIVDKNRMAVSGTTTLNGSYGSAIVVENAGFILNNQMDDFSIKPGAPNMYGLVGGTANSIEPGKRMLSSMTPTIVEKDGALFMVVGSPGGSTIITSVFQTIINVIDHKMTMKEAVTAPRFHHQWLPDQISYEEGSFNEALLKKLRNLGHTLSPRESIGRVDAIRIKPDGTLEGGADPRGDDTSAGF